MEDVCVMTLNTLSQSVFFHLRVVYHGKSAWWMRFDWLCCSALVLATSPSPQMTANAPPSTATSTDPRSICDRYGDETYAKMRDDEERTSAYEAAIAAMAPGRVCLDIGTGALALLALAAARSGARHVYAIEANPDAAAAARSAVKDAGMESVITIVEGYSTDVTLPEPVDLLLHEILGEVAGAEGVVRAVTDAAARHLAPDARAPLSVPHRARSLIAPAEFPPPEYFSSLPFPMLAAPGATSLKLPSLPRSTLLADAATFEDLAFDRAAPAASHDVSLAFVPSRDGELRGLAVHIEVEMMEGGVVRGDSSSASSTTPRPPDEGAVDISSARSGSHWPNVLLLLPSPVEVRAGAERILVRCRTELGSERPSYTFEVRMASGAVAAGSDSDEGVLLGTLTYPE